jgi:hypothetical protein
VEHPEKGRICIEDFAERCILEAGERFTSRSMPAWWQRR